MSDGETAFKLKPLVICTSLETFTDTLYPHLAYRVSYFRYLWVAIQIGACEVFSVRARMFKPPRSVMYAIPPAGQLSGPTGEAFSAASPSIKRALRMACASDRWSLMLQLTSNLASVIIKPSILDVSLCSHQDPQPLCSKKKNPFCDRGN